MKCSSAQLLLTGMFNSWDRTPIKVSQFDSWGPDTWTPGQTIISGNLILNAYGGTALCDYDVHTVSHLLIGSHNIDHDDGSEYFNSDGNVVAYAHVCKGNYGSHRTCNNNLVLVPGAHLYNPSAGGGGGVCAEEADNGKGSTFADKHFMNNTCVHLGDHHSQAMAYQFDGCSVADKNFNASCWQTGDNRFLVPGNTSVVVRSQRQGFS